MDIQALTLVVTEAEANQLLAEHGPKDGDVRNLRLRFTPEGVLVTGETKALFIKVGFETKWNAVIVEGRIVIRLASLNVAGLPAGKFRGLLLKIARDSIASQPGVVVTEEEIRVDVNEALSARRLPVTVRLTEIRCTVGTLIVEGR